MSSSASACQVPAAVSLFSLRFSSPRSPGFLLEIPALYVIRDQFLFKFFRIPFCSGFRFVLTFFPSFFFNDLLFQAKFTGGKPPPNQPSRHCSTTIFDVSNSVYSRSPLPLSLLLFLSTVCLLSLWVFPVSPSCGIIRKSRVRGVELLLQALNEPHGSAVRR